MDGCLVDVYLPRRRLGRLGREVSALGLGGAGLHGVVGRRIDDDTAVACVHRAIDLGIDYIDTSPAYGESERRLGLALEGGRRERVFLATKTGTGVQPPDYSRDGTFHSVERSLQRLGTDFLDLVHVHDPASMEPVLASGGAVKALLEFKEQGVIGGIGLGVRSHEFLLQAIHHGAFDAILTYADYNLVRQSARETLFPEAAHHEVALILGSPLLWGALSARPWAEVLRRRAAGEPHEEDAAALRIREWAERRGVNVLHLAIQFCLRERRISSVLVGAETLEEVEQNVTAASTPLPDEVWADLSAELAIPGSPPY